MKILIFFCLIFSLLGLSGIAQGGVIKRVFAQTGTQVNNSSNSSQIKTSSSSSSKANSSSFCTKVGNASGSNPCASPATSSSQTGKLPPGTSASCPVPGGKIGCASYGPFEPGWAAGFVGVCRVDSTGNGGHCNALYRSPVPNGGVGICKDYTNAAGNLIRTAKSIDVAGASGSRAGDPVYMPEIKGKKLRWYFKGTFPAGGSFGFMRLYQSEPVPEGIYTLHFIHVNQDSPALAANQILTSGEVGATMYPLGDGYVHVHVSVGLNIKDLMADNFAQYDPGWLAADRDLAMCTGAI